jgi:4-hydroxy-4-methyl-2-oxoglutarate aldolase
MLIAAISVAQRGDVLVVSSGDHDAQGGFGEILATACRARGIAGLVTDGGVRDGLAIKELRFPAFCPGLCMKGTVKETLGTVNQPISIGGVWVRPGDLVSADDDGVVIIRPEEAAEVVARARAREEKEAGFKQALRDGAELLELIGIDKVLSSKGCTYAD